VNDPFADLPRHHYRAILADPPWRFECWSRIERLVAGPYLELFAREQRPGWDSWGDQTNKFNQTGCSNDDAA
jgi:N6-adenosine-specific RNA methylase IME4